MGLWVRSRNKDAVLTVETSIIPEAKKKERQVRSNVKVMLTVFFDSRGVVHHEYAPRGTTITKEYYQEVLQRLRDSVRRKRPDLWAATTWQLHQDNATAHSSHLIQTFLAKHSIPMVRLAPYSPDMAPCDFWLFPKLKMPLKGARFESREDIMQNAMAQLNTIPKDAFHKCFQQWRDCWDKCVHYQGDCFEGD
jgi:histone-lysine N-methyltransferase SETMAR